MRSNSFVIKLQKRKENISGDGNIIEPVNTAANAGRPPCHSYAHTTSYRRFRWDVYFNV